MTPLKADFIKVIEIMSGRIYFSCAEGIDLSFCGREPSDLPLEPGVATGQNGGDLGEAFFR